METEGNSITISEVMEYLFCPRFTYFMNCLSIPQHEEQRYKVIRGRELHHEKTTINKQYLRKKIGCTDKHLDVYLYSSNHHIRGVIDEVLLLNDGTYAPLDYKFAEYKDHIFKTYRFQLILYGLMIQEQFNGKVIKGYVVFTRSNNLLKEVSITADDYTNTAGIIKKIFYIIEKGILPKRTADRIKCIDCCYKNICV